MPRVIIIGGVAGGAATAARLRRMSETAEILLIERGPYISYATCGLPYYLGGVIEHRSRLFVQTPAAFSARFNVDVRCDTEATAIDRSVRTVTLRDRKTGAITREAYDNVVLSPGAEPIRPPLPGMDNPGVFTLRSIPDTDAIAACIRDTRPRRAVVVGGGFIGLEMAENLKRRGMAVSLVELQDQVLAPLDPEMVAPIHRHLVEKGVDLRLGAGLKEILSERDQMIVRLEGAKNIAADLVIVGVGVRPESGLAKDAGLRLGSRGAIVVDEYLRTSDPAIYALGDAIEFPHPVTGKSVPTYLAGPANKQARIVADNIALGPRRRYRGALGTAVAQVFDLTAACTGLPEKVLKAEGVPYRSCITHSGSHAGYFPGAKNVSLKLLFSPEDGRILGAQAVGQDGVDKRIDVIAALMGKGGDVRDLAQMEHSYAPPYSSARDPVNVAGSVAENILDGLVVEVGWRRVAGLKPGEAVLLDVREHSEFDLGHLEGAINIPLPELRDRVGELERESEILVYCGVGLRAYVACRILTQHAFPRVRNISGGWRTLEAMMPTPQLVAGHA